MDRVKLKSILLSHERFFSFLYRLIGRNRIKVAKNNYLSIGNVFMKRCRIFVNGKNNRIVIESGLTRLSDSTILVSASDCQVFVGSGCNLKNTHLIIEDNNGSIAIKKHVTISGQTEIAVIEGTAVTIGEDCLFSAQINLRTGDSHSILEQYTRKRINPSQDIEIGNHVWIGNDVKILKGVHIGENCIVATGAILTGGNYASNSIIGGIGHGKILKSGIDWCPQRIKFEK